MCKFDINFIVRRMIYMTLMLALTIPLFAALPEGGTVTEGSAIIEVKNNDMMITQNTEKASIDWPSFNIGAQNSVNFQQPSSNSVAINRVVGNEMSTIAGKMTSNGKVVLINPNGMVFSEGSTINVGGLLASSYQANQSTADAYDLQKNNSKISNAGTITAEENVTFLGAHVENTGKISAKGRVVLTEDAKGDVLYLSDGELKFQVVNMPIDGNSANVVDLVTSSINHSGLIEAGDFALNKEGEVVIGGSGETIINQGEIHNPCGKVHIAGKNVALKGAKINVSGKNKGGDINIGGGYQGEKLNDVLNSEKVTVDATTELMANSESGDAGKVIVWSELATRFNGLANANAKGQGVDAGLIEISSAGQLGFNGKVSVHALSGKHGTVLFDPGVLTILNNTYGSGASDGNIGGVNVANPQIVNAKVPNDLTLSKGALEGVTAGNIALLADEYFDLTAIDVLSLQPNVNLYMKCLGTLIAPNTTIMTSGNGMIELNVNYINLNTVQTAGGNILITQPGNPQDLYRTFQNLIARGAGNVVVIGPINNGALPLNIMTDTGIIYIGGNITTTNQNVNLTSNSNDMITPYSGDIFTQDINVGQGIVTITKGNAGTITTGTITGTITITQFVAALQAASQTESLTQFSNPAQQAAANTVAQTFLQSFVTLNLPYGQTIPDTGQSGSSSSGSESVGVGSLGADITSADEVGAGNADIAQASAGKMNAPTGQTIDIEADGRQLKVTEQPEGLSDFYE